MERQAYNDEILKALGHKNGRQVRISSDGYVTEWRSVKDHHGKVSLVAFERGWVDDYEVDTQTGRVLFQGVPCRT